MNLQNNDLNLMLNGVEIHWDWVRDEIVKKEKIPHAGADDPGNLIRASLDDCLGKAKSLVRPGIESATKNLLKLKPDFIEIEDGVRFSTKKMPLYLKGSSSFCIFLVTLGNELEKMATRLMSEGDGLRGYLLDEIGSFAIESLAQDVEEKLRGYYESKDKSISMRFSPGYCDWPIEEQLVLKGLLDFSRIGVSLTKSCMMVPKKSISAMVGIGPKAAFRETGSPCKICDRKDCDHRR